MLRPSQPLKKQPLSTSTKEILTRFNKKLLPIVFCRWFKEVKRCDQQDCTKLVLKLQYRIVKKRFVDDTSVIDYPKPSHKMYTQQRNVQRRTSVLIAKPQRDTSDVQPNIKKKKPYKCPKSRRRFQSKKFINKEEKLPERFHYRDVGTLNRSLLNGCPEMGHTHTKTLLSIRYAIQVVLQRKRYQQNKQTKTASKNKWKRRNKSEKKTEFNPKHCLHVCHTKKLNQKHTFAPRTVPKRLSTLWSLPQCKICWIPLLLKL